MPKERKLKPKGPDLWKRIPKTMKQVKHLPCYKKPTKGGLFLKVGTHTVGISTGCSHCGQPLSIDKIVKTLKKLKDKDD